jgi:hypothetical protein
MFPFLKGICLWSTDLLLDERVTVLEEKAILWFSRTGTPPKKYDDHAQMKSWLIINFVKQVMVIAEDEDAVEYARTIIFSQVIFLLRLYVLLLSILSIYTIEK